jgi:hypothetical protein
VREAHHTNLLSFVGACLEKPNVCILSSYCAKGASCTRPTQHCPKCSYLSNFLLLSHCLSLDHSITRSLSLSFSHCRSISLPLKLTIRPPATRTGSLDNILANPNVKLDMTFKESMLKDIAKGLTYLHGSCIGAHGRLSSDQCVIDSRWTVQVSTLFASYNFFYSSTLFRIV